MSVQGRMLVHPDIKSENQPERAAHFLDVPNMPWEATKFPGIKIKALNTTTAASPRPCSSLNRAPLCRCTSTRA